MTARNIIPVFLPGAAALLLVAACGETADNSQTTVLADNGAPMTPSPPPPNGSTIGAPVEAMSDQQFADMMAAGDAYEVAAGNLAKDKATATPLKEFAAAMVTAHNDSTAKLKATASKASPVIAPNPAMNTEQRANLDTLRDATGEDFDNAYKAQQVVAHEKALVALETYAASGQVAELKAHAAAMVPAVRQHLDRIRNL